MFRFLAGNAATKKVKRTTKKGSTRHSLRNSFKAQLGVGVEIKDAVRIPPGQDRIEWIAMQTMELYNTMNLVCNFVTDVCNDKSCPEMSAGKGVKYLWADDTTPKPIDIPAPQYIQRLINWIDNKFADESLFPMEGTFPKNFEAEVKTILKRMFRVYAHIYHSHLTHIKSMGSEAHLNTCFKHFVYFVEEFSLVESKDMDPMHSFISKLPQLGPNSVTEFKKQQEEKAAKKQELSSSNSSVPKPVPTPQISTPPNSPLRKPIETKKF